jgi:hypothetical protein
MEPREPGALTGEVLLGTQDEEPRQGHGRGLAVDGRQIGGSRDVSHLAHTPKAGALEGEQQRET